MPPASAPTPPVQPPAQPSPHPKPREVGMGAFVVVAAIVIAVILSPDWRQAVFPFLWPSPSEPFTEVQVEKVREPETLSGKIYMSLAPLDSDTDFSLNLYTYDVENGALEQITASVEQEYLTSNISPDGTKIAFATLTNDGEKEIGNMRLFVSDREMTEMSEVRDTADLLVIKRNPTWSPDGKQIAFQGKTEAGGAEQVVENWGVYVHDVASGATRLITTGVNPVFLPDSSLAVLKKDGLYRVNPSDKSEVRVIPVMDGDAIANMKLDVSTDGTKIVWAVPQFEKVHILEVESWSPFIATTTISIDTGAFWPTFSPKGEYVAMEVFDFEGEGVDQIATNQRLAVFSLKDHTWSDPLDLMPFNQEAMFITDWR